MRLPEGPRWRRGTASLPIARSDRMSPAMGFGRMPSGEPRYACRSLGTLPRAGRGRVGAALNEGGGGEAEAVNRPASAIVRAAACLRAQGPASRPLPGQARLLAGQARLLEGLCALAGHARANVLACLGRGPEGVPRVPWGGTHPDRGCQQSRGRRRRCRRQGGHARMSWRHTFSCTRHYHSRPGAINRLGPARGTGGSPGRPAGHGRCVRNPMADGAPLRRTATWARPVHAA